MFLPPSVSAFLIMVLYKFYHCIVYYCDRVHKWNVICSITELHHALVCVMLISGADIIGFADICSLCIYSPPGQLSEASGDEWAQVAAWRNSSRGSVAQCTAWLHSDGLLSERIQFRRSSQALPVRRIVRSSTFGPHWLVQKLHGLNRLKQWKWSFSSTADFFVLNINEN